MVERDRGTAERNDGVRPDAEPVRRDVSGDRVGATAPARLAPRPEKGLPFDQALDETMWDHHAVFAALAK